MTLHALCFLVNHTDYFIYHFLEHMYLFVYFKSKKEHNYDRFVDLNILGAVRLVHSDLRIYRISFFLLDKKSYIDHNFQGILTIICC